MPLKRPNPFARPHAACLQCIPCDSAILTDFFATTGISNLSHDFMRLRMPPISRKPPSLEFTRRTMNPISMLFWHFKRRIETRLSGAPYARGILSILNVSMSH